MSSVVQGPFSASSSATPASLGVAFGANVTAGNTILVLVNSGQGVSPPTSMSVTDTRANTYTQDKTGAEPPSAPIDSRWYIFSAPITTGGSCTVTATPTAGSHIRMEIVVFEVGGLDNASLLETSNAGTPTGTGTTMSAGSLTTSGGGFLLAALQSNGNYTTFTPGSGWTGFGGSPIYLRRQLQYRITSAGGSYTADATANASIAWGAIAVAYRDAAPPPGATAPGTTVTAAASLIAGSASSGVGATASGVTYSRAASLITGLAGGNGGGTLQFQASGMEFGRRTGLGISTFALDAAVNYRVDVFADALTLGSPILTTGVVATDGAGKLPNLTNALLFSGTTYAVAVTRQADKQRAIFQMVAA